MPKASESAPPKARLAASLQLCSEDPKWAQVVQSRDSSETTRWVTADHKIFINSLVLC